MIISIPAIIIYYFFKIVAIGRKSLYNMEYCAEFRRQGVAKEIKWK